MLLPAMLDPLHARLIEAAEAAAREQGVRLAPDAEAFLQGLVAEGLARLRSALDDLAPGMASPDAEIEAGLQRLVARAAALGRAAPDGLDEDRLRQALSEWAPYTKWVDLFLGRLQYAMAAPPPPSPEPDVGGSEPGGYGSGVGYGSGGASLPQAEPPDPDDTVHAANGGSHADESFSLDAAEPEESAPETAPPDAGTATAEPPDPPRRAFPRLDAPEAVAAGTEFDLVVGLAAAPSVGVVGDAIERPAGQRGPYTLTVQVVAEGFRLRDGETWTRALPVTAEVPYPEATYHLTPEEDAGESLAPVRAESLRALYSIEGQTVGMAFRPVAVVREAALLGTASVPAPEAGHSIAVPARPDAADLEVRILYDENRDYLLWTFSSRHADLDLPDEAARTHIGDTPEAFAQGLIREIEEADAAALDLQLRGTGGSIADNMPPTFPALLREAARRTDDPHGRPSVLLLSQEPHVPWELALVDPPLDGAAPPHLSFQARVGRWVFDPDRPPDPPHAHGVRRLAAVSGTYDHPTWKDLAEARAEADALRTTYHAKAVPADFASVRRLCEQGEPPADLLHFAVHGKYAPGLSRRGLVLVDQPKERYLTDVMVRAFRLKQAPFVFLNACQVGTSNEVLGDYAGLAQAFIRAGASGVIAPLWAVHDGTARALALRFYAALARGTPPAEALRQARLEEAAAQSASGSAARAATPFAYQFFGHPALLFDWQPAP